MNQENKNKFAARHETYVPEYNCSVIATLRTFATKWKPCIVCYLSEGPMRYNDLFRTIPNISRKILSEHLKELENDSLIIRNQFDTKKQRVEYELSETGKSLMVILEQLQDWGLRNVDNVVSIEKMITETLSPKAKNYWRSKN
ncbi:MAG: helix-turn-helix domain-containing protein [Chryseolinea sp.]